MAKKKTNTAFKITVAVLLSLMVLIGVAIGVLYVIVNNSGEDFGSLLPSSFYVVVNGKKTTSDVNGYLLSEENPLNVEVHGKYSVKVIPGIEKSNNFDFTVDGIPAGFAYIDNLTDGFTINYHDNGFTIAPKGDLRDILIAVYPDNDIQVVVDLDVFEQDLFTIVVTSSDGANAIRISGKIKPTKNTTHITIDPPEIIF